MKLERNTEELMLHLEKYGSAEHRMRTRRVLVFFPKLIVYFAGRRFIVTGYEGITTNHVPLPCFLQAGLHSACYCHREIV